MGIKMNRARYNGQEIKISEYDVNKVYGKLKCYYCDADISFVNSHERDLGERKIIIQKYFRLKRGEEHEKGCKCEGLVRMFLRFRFCGIVYCVLYRFSFPQSDL